MGVGTQSRATYFSVADGRIVRTFKTAEPGTTPRTNKRGVVVHEIKYDFIEGILAGVDTREHEFGKDYVLTFAERDETYKVSIQYNSRYATSLLKALPNLDLNKPVKLVPFKMTDRNDKSKSVTGITVYQDGKKVEPFYTKDNPNGLPQMKQVMFQGKLTWDSYEMDQFLEKMAKSLFTGEARTAPAPAPATASPAAPADEIPFAEPDDDLPF